MNGYKPKSGFFDISIRPKTLDIRSFEKLQEAQMQLMHMQEKAEYFKKHHPQQWEKGKELSGQVQQIIFQHWSQDELFGRIHERD